MHSSCMELKGKLGKRTAWRNSAALAVLFAAMLPLAGQPAKSRAKVAEAAETFPALFLSDIHFDPFLDPGKVRELANADVKAWEKILAAAPSPDRDARYAAMQKACPVRGEDTSFALLRSSLKAMHANAAGARFVTVSGDLLAHSFDCKFREVFPHAAAGDYRAFVEKTLTFEVEQLRAALPGTPVYVALGNNDSDCGDYRLDMHSDFLAEIGDVVTRGFPEVEQKAAREDFAAGGDYSVRLPAPIRNARLVVLDDLFMSAKYATCGGEADASGADAQIAWLEKQLTEARSSHEKVWVMAHIPPGVDVYSTARHLGEVCGGKGAKMFLSSEKLAEVLSRFSDVVQLAIFAHTHMDEVRILKPEKGASAGDGVAVKMVSSISPINGNAPSFTLARVDSSTAALKDFKVFAASNATGVGTTWSEEYDWGKTYHQAEFSAAAVGREIVGFEGDGGQKSAESRAYISDFYVGASPLLGLIWPQYVCALGNDSAQSFKACVCPGGK